MNYNSSGSFLLSMLSSNISMNVYHCENKALNLNGTTSRQWLGSLISLNHESAATVDPVATAWRHHAFQLKYSMSGRGGCTRSRLCSGNSAGVRDSAQSGCAHSDLLRAPLQCSLKFTSGDHAVDSAASHCHQIVI